jgi:hypothetical protein
MENLQTSFETGFHGWQRRKTLAMRMVVAAVDQRGGTVTVSHVYTFTAID